MTPQEAQDWEEYARTASERELERKRRRAWPECYAAQERRRREVRVRGYVWQE